MIGYVTVGTNNLERAAAFYDELFKLLGAKRLMQADTFVSWGTSMTAPSFGIIKPYNKQAATVGNGCMTALVVDSKEKVNALHAKALALGATDEGAAGPRGDSFYAGYFRDLDGNKLNVFFMS